jgi:hypothetical protein
MNSESCEDFLSAPKNVKGCVEIVAETWIGLETDFVDAVDISTHVTWNHFLAGTSLKRFLAGVVPQDWLTMIDTYR